MIAMQSRLSTLLLLIVVLGSSLAVFGGWIGAVVFLLFAAATTFLTRPPYLVTLLVLLPFVALLFPAVNAAHDAVYQMHCAKCLTQISLALHQYHQAYGCFPPAFIADKNGKPMHSWRVLILPYLCQDDLYKQYKFSEPWDGPNNKKLQKHRPYMYACPSDDKNFLTPGATSTNYVAVVGAEAAWQGPTPRKLADFQGKENETIMLVELADVDIPWTEPKDVSLDVPRAASNSIALISSKHFSDDNYFFYPSRMVVRAARASAGACYLSSGLVASKKFPDVLKIGGWREEYWNFPPATNSGGFHWTNCMAFAVWISSTGLLLMRPLRSRKNAGVSTAE
jgi:hypothetical protein